MSEARMFYAMVTVAILCGSALIAQCSHRTGQCQESAIKAGIKAEEISKLCRT